MKTISYAITVKNELDELKRLITLLLKYKRDCDEIVVLIDGLDQIGDEPEEVQAVYRYLFDEAGFECNGPRTDKWVNFLRLRGDFAAHKNFLNSCCTKEYIFQIDADELPHEELLKMLPELLQLNTVDIMMVPRINTVDGITEEHINKWGWRINEAGWINFPDYQWRIYKNTDKIKWKNKVHEVLTGYKTIVNLPGTDEYCLYHPKTIERQEKQNASYARLTNI